MTVFRDIPLPMHDDDPPSLIQEKLHWLIIPRLEFRNTSVRQTLEALTCEGHRLDVAADSGSRGVCIWFDLGTAHDHLPTQPAGTPTTLTVTFTNTSLGDAIHHVAQHAGLVMTVGPLGVHLHKPVPAPVATIPAPLPVNVYVSAGDGAQATPAAAAVSNPVLWFLAWFDAQPVEASKEMAMFLDPLLVRSQAYSDFDYDALPSTLREWLGRPRDQAAILCTAYLLHQLLDRHFAIWLCTNSFLASSEEQAACKASWQVFKLGRFSPESIDAWYHRQPGGDPTVLPPKVYSNERWEELQQAIIAKYPAVAVGNSHENTAFVRAFLEMGGTPDNAMAVADLVMLY